MLVIDVSKSKSDIRALNNVKFIENSVIDMDIAAIKAAPAI